MDGWTTKTADDDDDYDNETTVMMRFGSIADNG